MWTGDDMASVKFTKDSREFQMMGEVWKILSEFYEPENTAEYWDVVKAVLNKFVKRWDNDLLAKHMARAVVLYLDEKMHAQEGKFDDGNDRL